MSIKRVMYANIDKSTATEVYARQRLMVQRLERDLLQFEDFCNSKDLETDKVLAQTKNALRKVLR